MNLTLKVLRSEFVMSFMVFRVSSMRRKKFYLIFNLFNLINLFASFTHSFGFWVFWIECSLPVWRYQQKQDENLFFYMNGLYVSINLLNILPRLHTQMSIDHIIELIDMTLIQWPYTESILIWIYIFKFYIVRIFPVSSFFFQSIDNLKPISIHTIRIRK